MAEHHPDADTKCDAHCKRHPKRDRLSGNTFTIYRAGVHLTRRQTNSRFTRALAHGDICISNDESEEYAVSQESRG